MTSVRPSLRLARPAATARRLFSYTSAARWASPRPSLVGLPIDVHPEVQAAQAEGRAIVALESTLITHGTLLPLRRSSTAAFASRRANRCLSLSQACHHRTPTRSPSNARRFSEPRESPLLLSPSSTAASRSGWRALNSKSWLRRASRPRRMVGRSCGRSVGGNLELRWSR